MKPQNLLLTITALLFFQSCSIQKKRYTSGWNIGFETFSSRHPAKKPVKKPSPGVIIPVSGIPVQDAAFYAAGPDTLAEILLWRERPADVLKSRNEPFTPRQEAVLKRKRNKLAVSKQSEQADGSKRNDRYGVRSFVFVLASLVLVIVNLVLFPLMYVLSILAAVFLIIGFVNFVKSGREKKRLGRKMFYNKGFSTAALCIICLYFFIASLLMGVFLLLSFAGIL